MKYTSNESGSGRGPARVGRRPRRLDEPPSEYKSAPGVVTSPARREGKRGNESWIAIVGTAVEPVPLEIPYEHLAVAARIELEGRRLVVYGTVLPWLSVRAQAPYVVENGEQYVEVFK